jgi:serine/threonine protein kinase
MAPLGIRQCLTRGEHTAHAFIVGDPAVAVPKQLGRYQVLKHLASGGMAEVLLARTRANDGTTYYVVIKRIRREQAHDARFVRMFLDEAQLAASLYHPNIVRVFEIGEANGEYFFAMEYVHGEDLRKVLIEIHRRDDQLPIATVLGLMTSVAAGLHHAHEALGPTGTPLGLVHRDVSPANILVAYDGSVKVADFGIAKATLHTAETRSGTLKGKVSYMSPEQVTGRPIDRRSDVFALGIVFYEVITARRLFKGDNDFLTMSAIVQGDIPPPSITRADVPRPLEEIIMKALATNPSDRFQTAEDLRASLERFTNATGLRTSTTGLADYMKKLFGQRPEPWLTGEESTGPVTIDFDGSDTGVVRAPEAAVSRFALPRRIGPTSPIVIAHNEATGQSYTPGPIGEAPQRNVRARTEAVTALGYGQLGTEQVVLVPAPSTARSWLIRGGVAVAAIGVIAIVVGTTGGSKSEPAGAHEPMPAAVGEKRDETVAEQPEAVAEPAAVVEHRAAVEKPAPVVEQPATVVEHPAAIEEPAPVVDEPAPVVAKTLPVAANPTPVQTPALVAKPTPVEKHAPVGAKPTPVDEPAPVAVKPPVAGKTDPIVKPDPTVKKPAHRKSRPTAKTDKWDPNSLFPK